MKKMRYTKPELMLVSMEDQLMVKASWRVTNPDGSYEQRPIGQAEGNEIEVFSKQGRFWDDEE